jgi:methylase of polypeptide subunit release factors
MAQELVELKNNYMVVHDNQKAILRNKIHTKQKEIAQLMKVSQIDGVINWRVQFPEVMGAKDGFDIVLANPPYVRKEKIPAGSKATLQEMYKAAITGQSDLYCAFYMRALELLNLGGMHVFICSNSWLDVGYGGKLQKYLLENSHIQKIYDSSVQRQFATADINTIISILRKGPTDESSETSFINFQSSFSDSINNLRNQKIRIVRKGDLIDAGSIKYASGDKSYVGDKWGGKYLRAPDVYFSILKSAKKLLSRLDAVADIQGYIHDNNTGDSFPEQFFLKSVPTYHQAPP